MNPDEFKAEFNSVIGIIRADMLPAVRDEVSRFQQSGLYSNELNIDTFTGAIDDEELSDTVRRNLRFAAGFKLN